MVADLVSLRRKPAKDQSEPCQDVDVLPAGTVIVYIITISDQVKTLHSSLSKIILPFIYKLNFPSGLNNYLG